VRINASQEIDVNLINAYKNSKIVRVIASWILNANVTVQRTAILIIATKKMEHVTKIIMEI